MATSNSTSPLSAAQRTSAKIILFAQSLSVISAGLGLIGLIVAYKVLVSNGSATTKGTTTRVPTIT
jgi:hypothetical protein